MSKAQTAVVHHISYWAGIAGSVACLALILAGNPISVTLRHFVGMPFSWLLGLLAIVAFIGAEYFGADEPACTAEFPLELQQAEL